MICWRPKLFDPQTVGRDFRNFSKIKFQNDDCLGVGKDFLGFMTGKTR